jgi:hypothetical protein
MRLSDRVATPAFDLSKTNSSVFPVQQPNAGLPASVHKFLHPLLDAGAGSG